MPRTKDSALLYARRSTDAQEISLPTQVDWAIGAAQKHGVRLDASIEDLSHMLRSGSFAHKGMRLDDGISGSDLTRPGFLALIHDAVKNPRISHAFIYKRDRFARPEDAMKAAGLEKQILQAGITIVFSDAVSLPIRYGEQAIMRDIELLLCYYQGGEELRKHSERVLSFQQRLAGSGFRVGGNAPYGFVRVLVDPDEQVLEELPQGKTVKQKGCHVRVIPKHPEKILTWCQILEWKEAGWGIKRIASALNERGIPSPDAGRTRTDHGVKHFVTGKWSPNTVAELCRNPIIIGLAEYGKRSEGRIRRLGSDGARLLDEDRDLTKDHKLKTIVNDHSLRVTKKTGEAQFEPERWDAIQKQMDARAVNQKGVPRAKDPARYPLSCCLVDLTGGCGCYLYGRTSQGRSYYTCGRYMRTSGAECDNNQVDGEAILRLILNTFGLLVDRMGSRQRLRHMLEERAKVEQTAMLPNPNYSELERLRAKRLELTKQREIAEYRMARERDNDLYAALARQFSAVSTEITATEEAVRRLEQATATPVVSSPDSQVDAALGLLDGIHRIAKDSTARAMINPLLRRLGVQIGLNFIEEIKGKVRRVRVLQSGTIAFGGRSLPVPLFGKDHVNEGNGEITCRSDESNDNVSSRKEKPSEVLAQQHFASMGGGECLPHRHPSSQPEGISFTKGSRGDRI